MFGFVTLALIPESRRAFRLCLDSGQVCASLVRNAQLSSTDSGQVPFVRNSSAPAQSMQGEVFEPPPLHAGLPGALRIPDRQGVSLYKAAGYLSG